jgi:hypothetical protein
MQSQNNLSPKARVCKGASRRRSNATLIQRIRTKQQYLHELNNPQEYSEMEAQLREWLRDEDFEIEEWADKTIIRWGRSPRYVLQGHTRGEAVLGVYKQETSRRITRANGVNET